MNNRNHGVLVAPPKPTDYVIGSTSKIKVDRSVKDWSRYLPAEESQRNQEDDFLICVTMSALHDIEFQLNYLLNTGHFSDEALFFFHNSGYIQNGIFNLSDRFNAKLNDTEQKKGNFLNDVGVALRRDGIVPGISWPMTKDMLWTEFYRDIPITLFELGRKSLWFLEIQFQWAAKSDFSAYIPVSPIQVATALCTGWDSGHIVKKCSNQPLQHATIVYGTDESKNWLNLDHYPPFKQKLAVDYEFPLNMQYVVTLKPITLRKGMYGKNVLQLQKDLSRLGFILKEDSDFGPKTEMMVRNFQNKNRSTLISDGIAGPKTLAKLKELLV